MPWEPKTYRFKGSTLYFRGQNLLFGRKTRNPKPWTQSTEDEGTTKFYNGVPAKASFNGVASAYLKVHGT